MPDTPKGQQATETILTAAETLFLSQGYNGTSMRDIARAAGYRSVAGLYNHFDDKAALFQALLWARSPYDEIFSILQHTPATDAADYLPQIFDLLAAFMADHMNFIQLVMIDFLEFNAAHMQALITAQSPQLMRLVASLEHVSGFREDLPPLVLIRLLTIQLFGYMLTQNILPNNILDTYPPEVWRGHVQRLMLHGLIEKEEHHDH